uniref:Predicted protein n=1 Tax=Hordeum vulgare subsp. vulgare TaxID=112509 RepID=F2E641_HORVV|nr:predicted protein [Hordeum vulgare subsp. vulgare]
MKKRKQSTDVITKIKWTKIRMHALPNHLRNCEHRLTVSRRKDYEERKRNYALKKSANDRTSKKPSLIQDL